MYIHASLSTTYLPVAELAHIAAKGYGIYVHKIFIHVYNLCLHIFYEHVYICITFANSLMPSLPTLLAIAHVDVYLQVLYTANPTWGDIFESSKLKDRTSLLPRFSEKRHSSFKL